MLEIPQQKLSIDQIEAALRERIRRRTYLPGGQLPTELALTAEFGVSRATVRTVLTRLANEGLIIRRQGAGTYVNRRVGEVNTLGGLLDYGRLIAESGHQPTIQPISITHRGATELEADLLQIALDTSVVAVVRLFLADERPFILATNVIPQTLFTGSHEFYDGRLPLHDFLLHYCQETIAFAIYEISPGLARDEMTANLLECSPGTPLLEFSTTFYNNHDRPIVWGHSAYNDAIVPLRFMQSWS